jgi:hypothetical protein
MCDITPSGGKASGYRSMIEVASLPRERHQCSIDHADRRSGAVCQADAGWAMRARLSTKAAMIKSTIATGPKGAA